MIVEKKACTGPCAQEKPLNCFRPYKARGKQYISGRCDECRLAYNRRYLDEHPEKVAQNNKRAREWRRANPEIVKGWDSKKYQKGRPENLARQKRYYAANKERISEKNSEYRKKNGDHLRAVSRERGRRLAQIPGNREKDRIRARAARAALKIEVLTAYGGLFCQCCNETCIDMLNLDHKFNDGAAHRRSKETGDTTAQMYRWARKNNFPPIFKVMCFNCNIARVRTPGNVCPHEIERLKLAA